MPEQAVKNIHKIKRPHIFELLLTELAFVGFVLLIYSRQQKLLPALLFLLGMTLCVVLFAIHDYRESRFRIRSYEIGTLEKKEKIVRGKGQNTVKLYFLTVRTDTGSACRRGSAGEYRMNSENSRVYVVTIVSNHSGKEKQVIVPV